MKDIVKKDNSKLELFSTVVMSADAMSKSSGTIKLAKHAYGRFLSFAESERKDPNEVKYC